MADDGFHEIQLNGKQLIFLCMTAALVLVVAFLSGVLVGRGVRSQKDAMVASDAMASPAATAVEAAPPAAAPAAQTAPPVTAIAPPTPVDEDLSYNSRLEGKQPPKDTLEPRKDPPASQGPPAQSKPAAKDTAKTPPAREATPAGPSSRSGTDVAKAEATLPAEPAGSGYYLKIVAYRDRAQADGVARRLSGKGYTAYVVPTSGRPVLYSVRVGKYKTRREADSIRRRLEKEEQLKPLISH